MISTINYTDIPLFVLKMANFKYEALNLTGPSFRLLRLLKGVDEPIQCQLFESKLAPPEEVRDYTALSYTWGSTNRPCEIVVNGEKMTVTTHAYLALRDLRYQEEDRFIWIDAICIDQNDVKERRHQIRQMGLIYSTAERVLIWLGEPTYSTNFAMRYIQQLEKEGLKHASSIQNISDEQWAHIWSAVTHSLSTDQKNLVAEGLQSLLHRDWFKRARIIQEVANAQAADVVCGSRSISTTIFTLMPSLLAITLHPRCQPILDIMPGPLRNRSWWAEKRDLYSTLVKFCECEATDPRDNIYAFLGISSDACDADLLRADYGKRVEDVIFDTTAFILNFNALDSPISRFFHWTLPEFLGNLPRLANEVFKCAMRTGQDVVARLLLERDDVDIKTEVDDMTPLSWAVEGGHTAIVRKLLELDDVDVDPGPLLFLAAERGHEGVTRVLLERGDINAGKVDEIYGQTPLLLAAKGGHEAVVRLLIERDDVNADSMDEYLGQTPLMLAAEGGHEAVVRLLLERNDVDVNSEETLDGRTPLSLAAVLGHEAVVRVLLECDDVYVDSKDHGWRTPLSLAAEEGHEAVVRLLLERHSVDVNSREAVRGRTPLSLAAMQGHEAVVRLLLEHHDVYVNLKDDKQQTPLSLAAYTGREAVVRLLLEHHDVNPNTKGRYRRTPLSLGALGGHKAVVQLLLEHDVDADWKDEKGRTPLWLAAYKGHEAVVRLLLERDDVDANSKDDNGQTPLVRAALEGHEAVVKLLQPYLAT